MTRLLWTLIRFCLCAWIGAATLFVVTGVREVTSDLFEPVTKNQLAALRFPAYYVFGFGLVGLATVSAGLLSLRAGNSRKWMRIVFLLCVAALAIMCVDHHWIYTPLEEMMTRPDARSTPEFATYHKWSKWINVASLSVCLGAALMSLADRSTSAASNLAETQHD